MRPIRPILLLFNKKSFFISPPLKRTSILLLHTKRTKSREHKLKSIRDLNEKSGEHYEEDFLCHQILFFVKKLNLAIVLENVILSSILNLQKVPRHPNNGPMIKTHRHIRILIDE